ncbi:DUF4231 domain-containing protein [Streptomyces luomodiensis]|uniref:DUF4231 domain-containing protein n=1 Tax=Streptomyces luomodiensis TaxID=3026192 RepID=A0ABY9V911_9ACTN|nr:DUF4231 domain-containing protein [Streptomyces sp. SCA4-21]WNF01406.1 DUF4231 domain-containing protein [Streptomyces sp. SCA4-21]
MFDLLREVAHQGRRFDRQDAFELFPAPALEWADIEPLITAAAAAGLEPLAPWSVQPDGRDPTTALVRYEHNDGGESVWKAVHIREMNPLASGSTWGDVVSHVLARMSALYRTVPDNRRSPRGPVVVPELAPAVRTDTTDTEESNALDLQGNRPNGSGEPAVLRVRARSSSEPYALAELDSEHATWVYEILVCLEHAGHGLKPDDAALPFPDNLDWTHVKAFIDAASEAEVAHLLAWTIFPSHNDPTRALVWRHDNSGSGALWSAVAMADLLAPGDLPEGPHPTTWGQVIEACMTGLQDLQTTADVKYQSAGEPAPQIQQGLLTEEAVRALVNDALNRVQPAPSQNDRERTQGPNGKPSGGGDSRSDHVERTLKHRRQAATLIDQIRLARQSRFLVAGSSLTAFLLLCATATANAIVRHPDAMLPYNAACVVLLLLLLFVRRAGRRMNTGHPDGAEPKSVAALQLELELLEERRILEASAGARSSRDRQHSYRETIPQEIDRLRRETRRYRRVHNFFQWSLFVASVTMSVTAALYDPPQPGKSILIALGAFVSFTTAVTGYFKYRERAFNLQQTADAIEQHLTAYDLAIPPYNQADEAANLERLAENIETLRVEQRKREQQLEQPHQGQQEVI